MGRGGLYFVYRLYLCFLSHCENKHPDVTLVGRGNALYNCWEKNLIFRSYLVEFRL